MEKIIQSKRDIAEMLITVRRDIKQICKSHFSNGIVTARSWETSANSVVSYHKSKIPMLKAAGVMKDPSEYDYGWSFNNDHYSNCNRALTDADKQIAEILNYLKDCQIKQNIYRFSQEELSLFQVIEGGGRDSFLVSYLKGGVSNV